MASMMVWSINLLILSILLLIIGMINPKWLLFWMERPSRIPIILLSSALFMGAGVMFGEANLEKQQEATKLKKNASQTIDDTAPAIALEPKK